MAFVWVSEPGRTGHRRVYVDVPWANKEAMMVIYLNASELNKSSNIKYQVDHMTPLVSDFVSGFHVEYNLTILDEASNRSKSDRWWPDMWPLIPELKVMVKAFKESEKAANV